VQQPTPRPAPVVRQPSNGYRPQPSQRTTPTPQPSPVVRTPRTNPVAPNVPDSPRITRPSPRTDTPTLAPDRRQRTPNATDNVWRDRPTTSTTRPTAPATVRPAPSARPRSSEATEAPRATVRPRPSNERASRYAPTNPVRDGATVTARPRSTAGASTAAQLVPRSTSPRLTVPRSTAFANGSLASGTVVSTGAHPRSTFYPGQARSRFFYDDCHRTFWRTWWDPCRYDSWSRWNFCGGFGGFGWSVSLWQPWWHYRTRFWNDCYFDSYWWACSQPAAVSTVHWWYPSTTYCPTYLNVPSTSVVYVPSSTVVYVDRDPPATETIVAGSAAGRSARVVANDLSNEDLAKRYVDLGDFYFEVGRYTEAADAYARAKGHAPDNATIHFAMADAAFAAGDHHYAAFLIGEAVRLQPSIVSAAIDRRAYYGDTKQFDDQMAGLERYLAEKPFDAQAHLVHGYNLRFSDQPAAATAAFRRVLEISPENRTAPVFLAALAPPNSEAVIR